VLARRANPDGKIVLDIVLSGQESVIDLPGLIVRVRAGDATNVASGGPAGSAADPTWDIDPTDGIDVEDLESLQQGFMDIILANFVTILLCLCTSGIIIHLEKKYKCIGGEKIHKMVEQQHQLSEDMTEVVKKLKHDGDDVSAASSSGFFLSCSEPLRAARRRCWILRRARSRFCTTPRRSKRPYTELRRFLRCILDRRSTNL